MGPFGWRPHVWPRGSPRRGLAVLRRAALRTGALASLPLLGLCLLSPALLASGALLALVAPLALGAGLLTLASALELWARSRPPQVELDLATGVLGALLAAAAVAQAPLQFEYLRAVLATGSPAAGADAALAAAARSLQEPGWFYGPLLAGVGQAFVTLFRLERPELGVFGTFGACAALSLCGLASVELALTAWMGGTTLVAGALWAAHAVADRSDHAIWPERRLAAEEEQGPSREAGGGTTKE